MKDCNDQPVPDVTLFGDERKWLFQRRPFRRNRIRQKFYCPTNRSSGIPENNSGNLVINPTEMSEVTVEVASSHGCSVNLHARFCDLEPLSSKWLKQLRFRMLHREHLSLFRIHLIADQRIVNSVYDEGRKTFRDFECLCECSIDVADILHDRQSEHRKSVISLHKRFTDVMDIIAVEKLTLIDQQNN